MENDYTMDDLRAELGCDERTLEKFLSLVEEEVEMRVSGTCTEMQFQRLVNLWWRSGAEDNFPIFRSENCLPSN